jgi:capsular exopolysaccharide synthesis family protein
MSPGGPPLSRALPSAPPPPGPTALATVPPVAWVHPLPADEAHFWDYWRVLVEHRWTVITFFLVSVIVGTVWTFTTRPIFTATATLRIDKEEPRVLKFEQVVPGETEDWQQTQYQTQLKVLQSRALASRVIGLLSLDQHPEFQALEAEESWLARVRTWTRERLVQWIPVPPPPEPQATEDLALESPLTRAFAGRLSVDPVRNARLVRLSFESYYPDLAARVVNTLAEAFIAQALEQKIEATRGATQFLAKQMEDARRKLEDAEAKHNEFLKGNDILFVTGGSDKVERQDLITQQLTLLSEQFLRARAERIQKESLVHEGLSRDADSLPIVLTNPFIAKLKDELVTMEGEYRKLGQTFKPEYPRMQRLEHNITEVKRQLRSEITRVVEGLDADYRAALRHEREIEKAMDEHRALARQLGDQMVQYSLLRRDVDTSRELYTALLTRLKETQISSALLTSNISVVDRAEIPRGPSKPRRGLSLLIASAIGLFGGIGLAFFFEYLDTNLKDAREVEAVLGVPTIGLVPAHASLGGRRARRRRQLAEANGDGAPPFALVAHTETESVLSEAFRNLRTSLLYSSPDHPPKTLLVTSLQPEDGKTSMATNLAIALGQLGAGEVLLIDGDMRRPNLHELLEVKQAPGLSTFLTGQADLPSVLKPTKIPNLYLIPAGRLPVNPAELMASARLSHALELLRDRFAHVVVDAPPLFGVSDAMILAPRVEGVLLVLRHGRASRDAAQRAVQLLGSVRARVLGVVLNDVDLHKGGSGYYGYYGYYGYGHGNGDLGARDTDR